MQTFSAIIITALAVLQGGLASPAAQITQLPQAEQPCKNYHTTTTTQRFHCDIVCLKPTVTCKPGQPPKQPDPTVTDAAGCSVKVIEGGKCNCATCLVPRPTPDSNYEG